MKQLVFFLLVAAVACNRQPKPQAAVMDEGKDATVLRYGMVTGVKPEKLDYYKLLHAKPWPQVMAKIKECHIQNYSIYLQKIKDDYFLFSYFEYIGSDFNTDMKKMGADTATQRWWKETDPCQVPLAEALSKHKIWTDMPEVFHLD